MIKVSSITTHESVRTGETYEEGPLTTILTIEKIITGCPETSEQLKIF